MKGCHLRSTKRSLRFVTQSSAVAGNGQDVAGKRAALEAVKRVLPLEAVVGVVEQAEEAVSAVDYKMAAEQVRPALHVFPHLFLESDWAVVRCRSQTSGGNSGAEEVLTLQDHKNR